MSKIRVITKRPGEPPRSTWISNTLENLQKTVGGYIKAVTIARDAAILCDEEGRLKGKPHNCTVDGIEFVGDIVVVGVRGDKFVNYDYGWRGSKLMFPGLWEYDHNVDRCVCCGAIIPEGRQVCPICDKEKSDD